MSLFQGQSYITATCAANDRWLYRLLCIHVHSQIDTGKPSAPKFMCANTEYTRPRVSNELCLSQSEKLPLWHSVVAHNYQYPFRYSRFLKCHGYEFILKNERNRLDRKGKITHIIFVSVYDGANSCVDANARKQILGFHVCCLYFKLE